MIKDYNDDRLTPKQKAISLLQGAMQDALTYWDEKDYETEGMTQREIQLVTDQMEKILKRFEKQYKVA